jgi:hypothetical protein
MLGPVSLGRLDVKGFALERETPGSFRNRGFVFEIVVRSDVFGRPGSYLLSQVLRLSTIGAKGFNGRVRDGIGF